MYIYYGVENLSTYIKILETFLLCALTTYRILLAINLINNIIDPIPNDVPEHIKCLGICYRLGDLS